MFSSRILFNLKSSVLYSNSTINSYSKVLASAGQLKFRSNDRKKDAFVSNLISLNNKPWYNLNKSAVFSTKASDIEKSNSPEESEKSVDIKENETPVEEIPLSIIAQKQLDYKLKQAEVKAAREALASSDNDSDSDAEKLEKKSKTSVLDPYIRLMRLDNPVPIFLTYWPGAWAILGAASYLNTMPDAYLLSLFALGAVGMRSAGCIINDMWDRKIDRQVERTKNRPLASGAVGLPSALALLGANLSVSLAVLMQLDLTTQVLGACCLFPVAIYPAAKRFTDWPQAILGVTFNWGALMGWSAVLCSAATQPQNLLAFLPAAALYAGSVNWTLFYDTIYGFQDKKYDEKLGLKSTAIHLQKNPRLWLLGFSSLFTSNLALFGYLTSQEPIFYITLGAAGLHLLKQIIFVKADNPKACMKQFKSNNTIGFLIAFGLLANIYLKLN